jgi:hypothetical protein
MNDTVAFAERQKNSFAYHKEISKAFGELDRVLAWCRTELTGDWRWQLIDVSSDTRPGRYDFFFDSERDMCAFVMRWT